MRVALSLPSVAWPGRAAVVALLRRQPLGSLGLAMLLGTLLLLLVHPVIAPYGPDQADAASRLAGPSARHLFGTDAEGRDVFSRILYGTRHAVGVVGGALALAVAVGVAVGLAAGLAGGLTARLLERCFQALGLFPPALLAMALVAAWGPSYLHAAVVLGLIEAPFFARRVQRLLRRHRESMFLIAARAAGNRLPRLVAVHLLPGIRREMLPHLPHRAVWILGASALLGFVGVTGQPAGAEWGAMVRLGVEPLMQGQWWGVLFPGIALVLLGFGLHLVGDFLPAPAGRGPVRPRPAGAGRAG